MVVGGASGKGQLGTPAASAAGRQTRANQTKSDTKKPGAVNGQLAVRKNVKESTIPVSKVVSATTRTTTTTSTTLLSEKKNGFTANGSKSLPPSSLRGLTTTTTTTTTKTTEKKILPSTGSSLKTSITVSKSGSASAKVPSLAGTRMTSSANRNVTHNGLAPKLPTAPLDPNMSLCSICGRSFAKERIEKHLQICEKTTNKKRKVFDASKIRIKGTEAEPFLKKGIRKDPPKVKSNWRHQHETFVNTIRQAKVVQRHLDAGGKLSDLPPPPPSENPDYIPCPHCGRKFNPGVADRHIPKCKNILSNKKPVPKKK